MEDQEYSCSDRRAWEDAGALPDAQGLEANAKNPDEQNREYGGVPQDPQSISG